MKGINEAYIHSRVKCPSLENHLGEMRCDKTPKLPFEGLIRGSEDLVKGPEESGRYDKREVRKD